MATKNNENQQNGITSQQEKFVALLIQGKGLSEACRKLGIDRSTGYKWQSLETIQARRNTLEAEIKVDIENGLLALYPEAISVLRDCLGSETNMHLRYKAAVLLIEKAESMQPGPTDPRQIIDEESKRPMIDLQTDTIDEDYRDKRLRECNLE